MKKTCIFLCCAMLSLLLPGYAATAENNSALSKYENGIYMSPDSDGDGTKENPLGSFEKLTGIITEMKRNSTLPEGGLNIYMRGGNYEVTKSINFGEELSGTKDAPIRFIAADGEKPVFTGGIILKESSFDKVTDKDALKLIPQPEKVLSADVSSYLSNYSDDYKSMDSAERTVYFGESPMTICRWPNKDFAKTGEIMENENTHFKFVVDDSRVKRWKNENNGMIFGYFAFTWAAERRKIVEVDTDNLAIKSNDRAEYGIAANKPYYVYNLLSELDYPGEYYFDSDNGKLYIIPLDDIKNSNGNTEIKVSLLTKNMFEMKDAHDIEFSGLTFENSMGLVVNMDNSCKNISFKGCTFKNINAGLYIDGYDNVVSGCDFYNIMKRPVTLYGGDRETLTKGNNLVTNCKFRDCNIVGRTNTDYIVMRGCGNIVSHCEFVGSPHIAVGMNGNDNVLEYNEFYNNMIDGAGDAGVIYTGRQLATLGNIIRYNYFHDNVDTQGMIYLDDMNSDFNIYGNVFADCAKSVFVHGGIYNKFTDNLVMNTARTGISVIINGSSGNQIMTATPNNTFLQSLAPYDWKNPPWNKYSEVLKYVDNDKYLVYNSSGVPLLPTYGTVISNNIFYEPKDVINVSIAEYADKVTEVTDNQMISMEENPDFEIPEKFKKVMDEAGIYEDEHRSFITELKDFNLIGPEDKSENVAADSVTFEWEKVDDAKCYLFTLSTDKDFKNIISNKIVNANYVTIEKLNYSNTRYFWKVKAIPNSLKNMADVKPINCNEEYFTFLTAKKATLNKIKVSEFIETAAARIANLKEGSEPGDLKIGTQKEFDNLIAEAKNIEKSESIIQKEIDAWVESANSKFESLYYRRNLQYYDLKPALKDVMMWSVEPNTTIMDSGRLIQRKANGDVFGLRDKIPSHMVMRFDLKTDTLQSWIGFGLRAQNGAQLVAWGGNPQYCIIVKEDIIELQRFGGQHFLKEYPNEFIKAGETHSYELGAENLDDGSVKLHMLVDGKNVFEYIDNDGNQIVNSGYFSIYNTGAKMAVEVSEYSLDK
ncbi:MAG: right-handed parallel beta-helix repeat-containing protein [Clostridia bacterium]|nr:right-handed parallel beta-helix repeat-containing protein [Clostridia bacterium]